MSEVAAPVTASRAAVPVWVRFFAPVPPIAALSTDPVVVERAFGKWQGRVLLFSIIGYATFYLVRKNLPIAMPLMQDELHLNKSVLGLFITLHGVLYGIAKFTNGFLGDRCNARAFFVVGLAGSAALNIMFGFGSTAFILGLIWMLNGWFQGMGFPPCARLLTHWFSPKQLATKMSIWNTSHCIGAVVILILGGFLITYGWRLCFFVPAVIALVVVALLWFTMPDTPASVGLPEVEGTHVETVAGQPADDFKTVLLDKVFLNKNVWLVSIANFFVYILRYAVFDWGPTLLHETKHITVQHAAWMLAGFEVAGAFGALTAGWITDRWFAGRGMRVGLFYMVIAGVSLLLFWKVGTESRILNLTFLCAIGFFVYGPQCLIGIAAANLATKRAAATAVGLTGLFGYLSTVVSGWGLGTLVKYHGWDAGFVGLLIVAAIGTVLFAVCWPAKAHGYKT